MRLPIYRNVGDTAFAEFVTQDVLQLLPSFEAMKSLICFLTLFTVSSQISLFPALSPNINNKNSPSATIPSQSTETLLHFSLLKLKHFHKDGHLETTTFWSLLTKLAAYALDRDVAISGLLWKIMVMLYSTEDLQNSLINVP